MKGIYLEARLHNSKAFLSLSKWSLLVFMKFMQKRVLVKQKHQRKSLSYRIANNGEIVFPYREAEDSYGINARNFRNSIDELIGKGFLDISRYGEGGRSGEATLYWIDDRWQDYGTDKFRPPKKPRRKNTSNGRGWFLYNERKKIKAGDEYDSATSGESVSASRERAKEPMAEMSAGQYGDNSLSD
ncbi:hypothetical protein ACFL5J_01480 [Thermodesulfobacteriota bacterium]